MKIVKVLSTFGDANNNAPVNLMLKRLSAFFKSSNVTCTVQNCYHFSQIWAEWLSSVAESRTISHRPLDWNLQLKIEIFHGLNMTRATYRARRLVQIQLTKIANCLKKDLRVIILSTLFSVRASNMVSPLPSSPSLTNK